MLSEIGISRPGSAIPRGERSLAGLLRFLSLGVAPSPAKAFATLVARAKSNDAGMSPEGAAELMEEAGACLVDIRERKEFASVHAGGALHLKRSTLEAVIERHVPDQDAHVICYCNDGTWSALAASTLRRMGYANATFLDGGLRQWISEGLQVRRAETFDE